MHKSRMRLVAGMLSVVALAMAAPIIHADDESLTVLVRFYPAPGREADLQTRLSKLTVACASCTSRTRCRPASAANESSPPPVLA
jgi:hypothetical protein